MSTPIPSEQVVRAFYTLVEADYLNYHKYLMLRQVRKLFPAVLFLIVVIGYKIIGTVLLEGIASRAAITALLAICAPIFLGVAFMLVIWNNTKRTMKDIFSGSRERTFEANAAGFALGGGERSGSYRWFGLQSIESDRNNIYFFSAFSQAFYVPKRAFGNTDQAKSILEQFQSWYRSSGQPAFAYSAPHIAPESQRASVTYQCTEADVAKMFGYLLKNSGAGKRIRLAAFGLPLVVVAVGVAINFDRIRFAHDIPSLIPYCVGSFVWSAYVLAALSPRSLASKQRRSPMLQGPQTLAIGPSQLANTTILGTTLSAWSYIKDILLDKGDLLIAFKGQSGLIIPCNAFSAELDAAAFATLVNAAWKGNLDALAPASQQAAAWPPAPTLVPSAQAAEAGDP